MEGIFVLAALVFYLLRAAFRGMQRLANRAKPRLMEQANRSVPSQLRDTPLRALPPREIPRQESPLREQGSAERPVRERAAQQPTDLPEEPLLRTDPRELARGLIWQEILAPPLSLRGKRPQE